MDASYATDSPAEAQRRAAIATARRLVQTALSDTIALRGRVLLLADATDWRSRAAEGYRAGMTELRAELDRLLQGIATFDDDLAAASRRPASSLSTYGGFPAVGW